MLRFKVFGCGAAGNKAVADLIESGYNQDKCVFLNSTTRDIPEKYKNDAVLFGKGMGGCGKERKLGKKMLIEDLSTNSINLDKFIEPDDNAVVLVGSTEGGSGSASMPILAKYFNEVCGKNVICVLFFGFQQDTRGLQNSIELCQELSDEYTVVGISNAKFLPESNGNIFKAEKAANQYFIKLMKIISGFTIYSGTQVIDDTDLFKVVTTPGYLMADSVVFESVPKNLESFNTVIKSMMDENKFIDPPKNAGMKREALIFNMSDDEDNIDYTVKIMDDLYGVPYEKFTNLSVDGDHDNSFSYIISGMKLPSTELSNLYKQYIESSKRVDKTDDEFSEVVAAMRGNADDSQFDVFGNNKKSTTSKKNFFASFGVETEEPAPKSSKKVKVDTIETKGEY